ncbi:hypothetical protein BGZ76_001134 [Entomortierella beljakovae]|nr:hypothetical protein BGZ76_001134 [Entomortierella beljakovae]
MSVMSSHIVNIQSALPSSEVASRISKDDGEFVGCLFDTILYERACYRLYELKRNDFPLKYSELAHDFSIAYQFCLSPKFLDNRYTAIYSSLIAHSKLVTAKGVRGFVLDNLGLYGIYPEEGSNIMDGDEVEEIDDDDFSDYDEVDEELKAVRKNVGYRGPILISRGHFLQGPIEEGQAHRDGMADNYFTIYKHSQDMIAAIIAHMRKRVWYNEGSGGEVVPIKNMGVDGKGGSSSGDQEVPNVVGVKKYTRRFNGRRKRANYENNRHAPRMLFAKDFEFLHDPPTDYTDSEGEDGSNGTDPNSLSDGVDAAIERLARLSLTRFTGSPKRNIQWQVPEKNQVLYDWDGENAELRVIDLCDESSDPTFYGRLTRDILQKYKKLQPPQELIEKHKKLKKILEDVIRSAFPDQELQVEAFGSFVSGLIMADSDGDFCITGPNIHEHEDLNDMDYLATILRTSGKMESVISIPNAMVPIVKFRDPQTNMECDLNTGNNLGVYNSELIRIYTSLDSRVKPFLFIIRAICKAQGINDSKSGYLSSYAITWMGIIFLQQDIPVLPRLQQQPHERMNTHTVRLNHNTKNTVVISQNATSLPKDIRCRYDDNRDGKHTGIGRANTKSLARLLIEFFEFFSRRFNYIDMALNACHGHIISKTKKEIHNETQRIPTFRVVDPFLHHRNLTGTCRGESLKRVWRAFDHSYRMLSAGDLEGAMVIVE